MDAPAQASELLSLVESLIGLYRSAADTLPALAGTGNIVGMLERRAMSLRLDMFPPDPAIAKAQDEAQDEATVASLAAEKIAAVQAAPPGANVDAVLDAHSDATLAPVAAEHEAAVAAAKDSADKLAALDAAATAQARATLGGEPTEVVPEPPPEETLAGGRAEPTEPEPVPDSPPSDPPPTAPAPEPEPQPAA